MKWAVQEALYEVIGYSRFGFENLEDAHRVNSDSFPYLHDKAPAGFAFIAYAGTFSQGQYTFDPDQSREFWEWWLTEAIPAAWAQGQYSN